EPLTPPLHARFPVREASFSPDGTQIVAACGERFIGEGEVRIWKWKVSRPVRELRGSSIPGFSTVAFSRDGSRFGSYPGTVVFSAQGFKHAPRIGSTDVPKPILLAHSGHAYHASFSADGRLLATGTGTKPDNRFDQAGTAREALHGEAQVWDARSGAPL